MQHYTNGGTCKYMYTVKNILFSTAYMYMYMYISEKLQVHVHMYMMKRLRNILATTQD